MDNKHILDTADDRAREERQTMNTTNNEQPDDEPQFYISAPASNAEILRITPDGKFIWHENADCLISEMQDNRPIQALLCVVYDATRAQAASPDLQQLRHRLLSLKLLKIDPVSDEKRDAHNQAIDEAIWMLDSVGAAIQLTAHLNCGVCPGDGSICKDACKLEQDSPQPEQAAPSAQQPSETAIWNAAIEAARQYVNGRKAGRAIGSPELLEISKIVNGLDSLLRPTAQEAEKPKASALQPEASAQPADERKDAERDEIIREAVNWNDGTWPDQLSSGIMFFKGERITRAEFNSALAEKGERHGE